jgi:hypothetical protein
MSELHPDFPALAYFRDSFSIMTLPSITDQMFRQASTPRDEERPQV